MPSPSGKTLDSDHGGYIGEIIPLRSNVNVTLFRTDPRLLHTTNTDKVDNARAMLADFQKLWILSLILQTKQEKSDIITIKFDKIENMRYPPKIQNQTSDLDKPILVLPNPDMFIAHPTTHENFPK
jgi:hypothetical protein